MFDPRISVSSSHIFGDCGNWEKDVQRVALESCDKREDPSGLRAVFFLAGEAPLTQRVNSYRVGVSYLRQRLEGIRRAGFQAPMTERALEMAEADQHGAKKGREAR